MKKGRKTKNTSRKYLMIAIPAVVAIGVALAAFSSNSSMTPMSDASRLILGGSPILGEPNAPLTIVEWGDYQCTCCYKFHQNTKGPVMANFVDSLKVRFTFRDFTLNGPASVLAAEAAYCAGDQDRYWEYHDELYNNWEGENTGWVTTNNLKRFATNVGLDMDTFDKCVQGHKYNRKVLDNYTFGQAIGVNATPTFIIVDSDGNTQIVRGAQPYSVIEQVLNEKLRSLV